MTLIKRCLVWVVSATILLVLALLLHEALIFAARDETSALVFARRTFLLECKRNGLNPDDFNGPERIVRRDSAYEFRWINPQNEDEIIAMTAYLPVRSEAWLWRGDDLRAIKEKYHIK